MCVWVRCHAYTCFIISMVFSCFMLLVQADIEWPAVTNGYFLMIFMVLHNIFVWLHLTDTFSEVLLANVGKTQYSLKTK